MSASPVPVKTPAVARGVEDPAIQVENVRKRYGALEVLKGVNLTVAVGQFTAIMGKSGSGKSTLLGVIAGLEPPDEGQVLVMGQKLAGMSDHDMADLRRRAIGIVFQGFSLIPSLSALDNVLLPTFFAAQIPAAERRQRAVDLLKQVGLGERLNYRPSALSGGEQQRVAIARALMNGPSVLLADEPTGNLDQETGTAVLDLLLDLGRTHGTTLVIVTHDPDVAAKAGRIVEMKDGRISDAHSRRYFLAALRRSHGIGDPGRIVSRLCRQPTVEIIALSHWPVQDALKPARDFLGTLAGRVQVVELDAESPAGEKRIAALGLKGHIPILLLINGSDRFKRPDGTEVEFKDFPAKANNPLGLNGTWTEADFEAAVNAALGEPAKQP